MSSESGEAMCFVLSYLLVLGGLFSLVIPRRKAKGEAKQKGRFQSPEADSDGCSSTTTGEGSKV